MVTTINYLHYYDGQAHKEVRKRYSKPATITTARADAIRLLRSGKVGTPPIPFAVTFVVLAKNVDGDDDGMEGVVEQVILSRAVTGRSGVFYCARAWDQKLGKWIWLYDNGKIRTNVQPW